RRFIVRANDAHAWTLAWVGGAWREIDTTPGEWIAAERKTASFWTPLGDLWSWATYLFLRWRWSERDDRLTGSIGWLLVPLIALLAWRLYRRRRVAGGGAAAAPSGAAPPRRPGADSAFYLVERRLAELAFPRAPGESLARWLARVESAPPPAVTTAPLTALLTLHYRYRFDPAGLGAAEPPALERGSDARVERAVGALQEIAEPACHAAILASRRRRAALCRRAATGASAARPVCASGTRRLRWPSCRTSASARPSTASRRAC